MDVNMMDVKSIIEGLLFAVGEEGLSAKEIAEILELPTHEIEPLIHEMRVDWKEQQRGIQIIKVAKKLCMTTLPEHEEYIKKLAVSPSRPALSRAALETLAIVAYKQPITRVQVEEIRGVKSERVIRLLQAKGLVRNAGRSLELGRPILYGTTKEFLDYFGLNSLDDLPNPNSIFDWQEQQEDQKNLFKRLGIESSDIEA